MKRRIQGLRETNPCTGHNVPDGIYLVRVDRAQYRWHQQKPFYSLSLSVLEPRELAGRVLSGRLYCSARAVWKLSWFLRDFLYDPELLSQDEVDEAALSGLRGVVKISHTMCTAVPCSTSTASRRPASGRHYPRHRVLEVRSPRWPDDVQLHPAQPVLGLSSSLSLSLPGRLA